MRWSSTGVGGPVAVVCATTFPPLDVKPGAHESSGAVEARKDSICNVSNTPFLPLVYPAILLPQLPCLIRTLTIVA